MINTLRLCAFLLCLAAPSAFAQTATQGAPASERALEAAPAETVQPAVPPAVDPEKPTNLPGFLRASPSRAGGSANELNTTDRRATEKPPGGDAAAAVAGRDLYHGNYCGRGNRGEDKVAADELDEVCRRHDACYETAGHRSCNCDRRLKAEALAVSKLASLSREVRARAASVVQAADLMGCQEP
jgi:hypothetical protein